MKYLLLVLLAAMAVFPIYWMVLGSLRDVDGMMSIPPQLLPHIDTLKNYQDLFEDTRIGLWVTNTLAILGLTIIGGVLVSSFAGYALARFRFRGKQTVTWLLMSSLMIPGMLLFVPRFVIIERLGLWGSRWGVVLAYISNTMYIITTRNYILGVPEEIAESARMDGAGEARILFRLFLPLCKPILAALAIWLSITALTDYMWQYLVLLDPVKHTLLVGLIQSVVRNISKQTSVLNPLGIRLAAGTILFLPVATMFSAFQRYFRGNLTIGALKA